MSASSSLALVAALGLLCALCAATVRADTYYGFSHPGAPPTNVYGYGVITDVAVTFCSAHFTVPSAQLLSSVGVTWNPQATGNSADVSFYMALCSVAGAGLTAHTPIAVANNGAQISFPGYKPSLPNPSYFNNTAFSYRGSFTGLMDSSTMYAVCFSVGTEAAVYYDGYSQGSYRQDSSLNTFSGAFTPTMAEAQYAIFASTVPASDGAMYSDPFFHGLADQSFYVHGLAGSVYSLLSDRDVQLNARFVFLTNVTCPTLSADELSRPAKVHCSSHPGTYFGELGLASSGGDQLHIAAGGVATGFANVTVNGQPIEVGQSYGVPQLDSAQHDEPSSSAPTTAVEAAAPDTSQPQSSRSHAARSTLYVHRVSGRSVVVHAGLYSMLIENSDQYVDVVTLHVTSWPELLNAVRPEGLMGSTWNVSATIPPVEEQHRERDGQLMGCNTQTDKFCKARAAVQQQ